jgi:hypothetical protein
LLHRPFSIIGDLTTTTIGQTDLIAISYGTFAIFSPCMRKKV